VARGRWTSAPALVARPMGRKPKDATRAVISTGRSRMSPPSRDAQEGVVEGGVDDLPLVEAGGPDLGLEAPGGGLGRREGRAGTDDHDLPGSGLEAGVSPEDVALPRLLRRTRPHPGPAPGRQVFGASSRPPGWRSTASRSGTPDSQRPRRNARRTASR
jgi:hypothetical protein